MTTRIDLGIDIGTSSTKCCVICVESTSTGKTTKNEKKKRVLEEFREFYEEANGERKGVQDAVKILTMVIEMIQKIKTRKIDHIWTCGQMHGIVLWKSDTISKFPGPEFKCSNLYNWMFEYENDADFLKTLPKWDEGLIYPGFGMVTLAWLQKTERGLVENFDRCGTIMDLFVSILSASSHVSISCHNAHSIAYCTQKKTWQDSIKPFLPQSLELPKIVDCDAVLGHCSIFGTSSQVHVPSGDLQASVACLDNFRDEKVAYLIIGTSAQLCCLVPIDLPLPTLPPTVVCLPYTRSHKLLAACSMNGGNAIESILKYRGWQSFEKLGELLKELDEKEQSIPPSLQIHPLFIPERGNPTATLLINGVEQSITDLQLLESTHSGIISNLFSLFPKSLLSHLGITQLVLVGSAQHPRFHRHIQHHGFKIVQNSEETVISTPMGATNFAY